MVQSNRHDPLGEGEGEGEEMWGVGSWERTEWEGAWMVYT